MDKFDVPLLFMTLLIVCFLAGCGEGFDPKNESEAINSANKDTTPPFVAATIPTDGEADVPEDTRIIIQFSEDIKRNIALSGLLITSDKLEEEELKPPRGYSFIFLGTKLRISFPSGLRNNETYTVRLDKNRIIDTASNRMKKHYKFSFTIEGIATNGKPEVSDQRLSYLIWQDVDGIWHILWNSNWYWHPAPPSGSVNKPKPKPKPKPRVEQIYEVQQHLFTGTIISNKEFNEDSVEAVDFEEADKWALWSISRLDTELLQTLEEKNLIPIDIDTNSSNDKNVIIFEAKTGGADSCDGLSFRSDGTEFVFDLKIDDGYWSDKIFIGNKRKNPQEVPFKLKPKMATIPH